MVLMSFNTMDDMNATLAARLEPVSSLFFDIRPWSFSEWSFSKNVWLECNGLPPYAWSIRNLRGIGEK